MRLREAWPSEPPLVVVTQQSASSFRHNAACSATQATSSGGSTPAPGSIGPWFKPQGRTIFLLRAPVNPMGYGARGACATTQDKCPCTPEAHGTPNRLPFGSVVLTQQSASSFNHSATYNATPAAGSVGTTTSCEAEGRWIDFVHCDFCSHKCKLISHLYFKPSRMEPLSQARRPLAVKPVVSGLSPVRDNHFNLQPFFGLSAACFTHTHTHTPRVMQR